MKAEIDYPDHLENRINQAFEASAASDYRLLGPAISTVGLVGRQQRHETRWKVSGGYVVTVTLDQGGHTLNICRPDDRWPAGRFGPWDDHTGMYRLATMLKFGHAVVTHADEHGIRRYRIRFGNLRFGREK